MDERKDHWLGDSGRQLQRPVRDLRERELRAASRYLRRQRRPPGRYAPPDHSRGGDSISMIGSGRNLPNLTPEHRQPEAGYLAGFFGGLGWRLRPVLAKWEGQGDLFSLGDGR